MGPVFLFLLSFAALCLGPVLQLSTEKHARWARVIDSFVVVAVLALVFGEVAPAAMEASGLAAWLALLLGLSSPFVSDRLVGQQRSHTVAMLLAVAGLWLHSVADGLALASVDFLGPRGQVLAWAVILHRIPVGCGVWMLFSAWNRSYRAWAIALLLAIAVGTAVGQWIGPELFSDSVQNWGTFQAFAAGMLLHVVVHSISDSQSETSPGERGESKFDPYHAIGIAAAVLLWLYVREWGHPEDHAHLGSGHHHHLEVELRAMVLVVPLWWICMAPSAFALPKAWKSSAQVVITHLALWVGAFWAFLLALGWGLLLWGRRSIQASSSPQTKEAEEAESLLSPPDAEDQAWNLQSSSFRDLSLGAWSGAWLWTLLQHGEITVDWVSVPTLAVLAFLFVLAALLRPSLELVLIPCVLGWGMVPSAILLPLLVDAWIRSQWPESIRALHRVAVVLAAGVAGYALDFVVVWPAPQWVLEWTLGFWWLLGALFLIWAGSQRGIRDLIRGGLHMHGHGPPHHHHHHPGSGSGLDGPCESDDCSQREGVNE